MIDEIDAAFGKLVGPRCQLVCQGKRRSGDVLERLDVRPAAAAKDGITDLAVLLCVQLYRTTHQSSRQPSVINLAAKHRRNKVLDRPPQIALLIEPETA